MTSTISADFTRVFDIIVYQQKKYPQVKALNSYREGHWRSFSIHDLQQRADGVSSWLMDKGFMKGERVALMPKMGTPEWMMVDFGCQQAGLVVVPIHPTSSPDEILFMLTETASRACFTADAALMHNVAHQKEKLPLLEHLYHLEAAIEGYFPALLKSQCTPEEISAVAHRKAMVTVEDTLSIMYTSGTTGALKGAVLSHNNVVNNIKSILPILPLQSSHRVLSFLPFSHIFERTSCYAYLAFGVEVYFSTSRESVSHDFESVKPYFCTSVPRTLEKMYDFLHQQRMERNFMKRNVIRWAIGVGERYKDKRRMGALFTIKLFFARLLVLNLWRRRLGGSIRYLAVGSAALRPEISRLFSAAGVRTLSGYGMTEASPFITVNRPGLYQFGTVGVPIPGVDIRLADTDENGEGEIQVRGPNIMKGYYQRPELNLEVFATGGWLKTGDVGKMVNKRFLAITDRKKDIFKTSAGKYIAPQQLENHFSASPFILQSLILGFNRPYVTAVIVPNFQILQSWCVEQGIHWTAPQFMVHNIKVVRKMQDEVDRLNETLSNFQRVRGFVLSNEEWTAENKELSASFKLMRSKLLEKYKAEIEKLYE